MPAPYARRDWQTKTDRALNRIGRGSNQGRFPGTRPVPPSGLSRPGTVDYRDFGQLHKVDTWTVSGTSTSTFSTTFEPMEDSWNLMLNGSRVHASEFSVSGRTVTIASPTDLFKGAATQGSPWDLEMQYDYLTPGIVINDLELSNFSYTVNVSNPGTANLLTNPAAGSSVVAVVKAGFSGTPSVSGLGATWTEIATVSGGTGSADTRPLSIWLGTGATGASATATISTSGGGGENTAATLIEIEMPLTATGAQTDTGVTDSSVSLLATSPGLAVTAADGTSGEVNSATDTPASGWIDLHSGSAPRVKVRQTTSGETVQTSYSSTPDHVALAVIPFA